MVIKMEGRKSADRRNMEFLRSMINFMLGLEDYLQKDGKTSAELAGEMEKLYSRTGDMMGQDFKEEDIVPILEGVVEILRKKEARVPEKKQQVIPPLAVRNTGCHNGPTEVFPNRDRYQMEEVRKSEETTSLQQVMRVPYLVRKSTGEKIMINRDVFKIGKERSYVDYYVDNDAVSRNHADVIRQKDRFYLVDHNSLNHTFLDGRQIPSKQYVRMESGQNFVLADEAFIFYYETI